MLESWRSEIADNLMNEILTKAAEYREQAARGAVAHELSAEYHRHRGVQFGVAATTLSAVVGSTIFVTVITKLGLDGNSTISVPSEGWTRIAFIGFGCLSILAPVVTGLQTYLNHPGEAEKHKASSADYYRLQRDLDSLLARYRGGNLTGTKREDALKELDDISKDMEATQKNSITLTAKAYKDADAQLRPEGTSNHEA